MLQSVNCVKRGLTHFVLEMMKMFSFLRRQLKILQKKEKKRHRSVKIPNSLLALNADLSANVIKCEQHLNKGEGLRLFKYQGLSLTATPSKVGNFIGCNMSVMTRRYYCRII